MKIALAQINTTVGAVSRNTDRALAVLREARDLGAELVVFPEMTLTGYPPMDLLDRRSFITRNLEALDRVARATSELPACVVGYVHRDETREGKGLFNAAALCAGGKTLSVHCKTLLPTYDVFDEARYFDPAPARAVAEFGGFRMGISICEDIWNDALYLNLRHRRRLYRSDPIEDLAQGNVDFFLNIAASPFTEGKRALKKEMFAALVRRYQRPLLHVNLVGGNDSLIFDGWSNVFDARGRIVVQARDFAESLVVFEIEKALAFSEKDPPPGPIENTADEEIAAVCEALTLGIRDYLKKCGFQSAILGLSGGVDSAVAAALAVRALGADKVTGVSMPSAFSSDHSRSDARALAENLGITLHTVPIEPIYQEYLETLAPYFEGRPFDLAEENLQARVRGNILMAFANKFGHLVLSTGNKSEMAVGYCTLYGDMSGGLAVLSDVPKTMVYDLAAFLNRDREIIPRNTIEKPPSAELRPGQLDSDSLPPYHVLDPIIRAFVEQGLFAPEIIAQGFDPDTVKRVIRLIERTEYKRLQAAVGLKITHRAFGYGRRMPVARGADPD